MIEELGESHYLVRFSFTRFSVRMTMVSCKYFMRGATAWKDTTLTHSYTCYCSCKRLCYKVLLLKRTAYFVVVNGVWGEADVLDVSPQLRQHLHRMKHFIISFVFIYLISFMYNSSKKCEYFRRSSLTKKSIFNI